VGIQIIADVSRCLIRTKSRNAIQIRQRNLSTSTTAAMAKQPLAIPA